MDITTVKVEIPDGCNVIIGQTHFIKTAEDLYEIITTSVPQAKFGIAFTEASGPCLIRTEGNDDGLIAASVETLQSVGAGHVFCIYLKNAFPINVLNRAKGSWVSSMASRQKVLRRLPITLKEKSSFERSGINVDTRDDGNLFTANGKPVTVSS
jgi:adenosine/AMP kinase